jgi:hypothetical protein
MTSNTAKRRRWLRWPAYAVLAVFVLVAGLLLSLRTPFVREQIRGQVNAALADVFQGQARIDRIGRVGLGGIGGVDATVFDPHRRRVIRLWGLSVSASLPALAWQLVAHGDAPELSIDTVHVEHADVTLREDEDAGVTLASTFLPREPSASEPSPGAGPHLRIARLTIGSVWTHGSVAGSPPLDLELRQLEASLSQSPIDGFQLDVARAELVTRAMPLGVDPRGSLSAAIDVPAEDAGPLRLEVSLDGRAAESPLSLEASWVGDDLHARVELGRVPAELVNRQAEGLALDGELALTAEVDGALPQLDFTAELDNTAAHVAVAGYAVVSGGAELSVTARAWDIDAARIVASAPSTQLDLEARAFSFETDDGHYSAAYRLDVGAGRVDAQPTPPLWLSGRAELDEEDGVQAKGKLGADESGVALRGSYAVSLPSEREGLVSLEVDAQLDDPARLSALGLHVAGSASVSADLRPGAGDVNATAAVDLRQLARGSLQARSLRADATLSGRLDAPRVHATGKVEALSGHAQARLDYGARDERLELIVVGVDLSQLASAAGMKLPLSHGTLSLDARASRTAPSRRYHLNARGRADFGKLGAVGLIAHQLELPTAVPSADQLAALEGELSLHGELELEQLSPLLIELGVPIERTTGHVRFDVSARHAAKERDGLALAAQVATMGLRVIQQRTSTGRVTTASEARQSEPFALEGIDLDLAVRTWPASGRVLTTLILRDHGGTLAEAQGEAELARAWSSGFANPHALLQAPLELALQVPRRRLQALPPLLRPASLRGRVELEARLEGSLLSPRVRAELSVGSMRATGSREPIDADVALSYAPEGGEARVGAKLTRGSALAPVATANLAWTGDLRRIGESRASGSPLTADAQVELDDFPLDVVPLLVDRQLGGLVGGELKLKDWGRDARVEARLVSTSLTVAKAPIDRLAASAQTDGHGGTAEVTLEVGAGSAKATVDTDLTWGARPLPELQRRGHLRLAAKDFRLETLSPLVKEYVSELGGVLDATTEIAVTAGGTQVSGNAHLEKGVVQLPSIGQRFSDIAAHVSVADDQLKLERLDARGSTGRVSATGNARLDGFALQRADLKVEIAEHESLPITVEGAAIGEAWGTINASYQAPAQGEQTLDVDVPEFHLATPDEGGQSLQSLEPSEAIRVGARRADGKFVALPIRPFEPESEQSPSDSAQPLRINVALGRNVTVDRGRTAHVALTGKLSILVAGETQIDGRIELKGGKLDVSGKTFDIERGVVTFDGRDPANPTITATARWDGPEFTVYADYVGDVENGHIKLRAEPPLTQDEIASLLLFGSPDGTAGGGDNAGLAISLAGGAATQGLNKVIDDFTNLDVSARVDTTTGNARPELVFQVSPRVSAKVTRAVGTPAVGQSPDRTFLTLELHLKRSWALSAVFGDRGASALDLIWRKRY